MFTQLFIIDLKQLRGQYKTQDKCLSSRLVLQFSKREEAFFSFCKGSQYSAL